MGNGKKIFFNVLFSSFLIATGITFIILGVLLPFSFLLTLVITIVLQIPLFIFWNKEKWKVIYNSIFVFACAIILFILSLINLNVFFGFLWGLIFTTIFYVLVPRKYENRNENKLEYIIILLLLLSIFAIINFLPSYSTTFFISFCLIFFVVISFQFIYRNHLIISFLNILIGFSISILYFFLFANSKDSTISYIGIFSVLLFLISCFMFIRELFIYKKQKGNLSAGPIILCSTISLVVGFLGFANSKDYIAYSVEENGITYQISASKTFAVKADKNLEEVTLTSRYKDKPLCYAEGIFKDCKNIKKVVFSGNIYYQQGYFYTLFSKKEYEGSYFCGGYYVPSSLKFAVLDNSYTTNDLSFLRSIEVVQIKDREPTYLNRYMLNNNISKIVTNVNMSIDNDFLDGHDVIDVYAKNGIVINGNKKKINVHYTNGDDLEFINNSVIVDKILVKTFNEEDEVSLENLDIKHLGSRSVKANNVILPETIEGSDLNWLISDEQRDYFSSTNNSVYFVNNFTGDGLSKDSVVIGAGASFMKLSNSVDCANSNVKFISDYAFANNPNLFYFSKLEKLKKIGKNAFANCYNLFEFYLNDCFEFIDKEAFCNTGLTSIFIPKSVKYIGANAFIGSSIETIFLEADEVPESFDESFSNKNNNGSKFNVVCGASR